MKYFMSLLVSIACLGCEKLDPAAPGNLVAFTVMEDASIPVVHLSSTSVHYSAFGRDSATKVFILEGGPGDDFRYLLDLDRPVGDRKLSDDYYLIYHDYRGCGLSRRHALEELSLALSLRDLEELIDHFAPAERVVLIGHSHGAVVATQYPNKHPERVGGIVLIEPGALSRSINEHLPAANAVNLFGGDINRILWVKQLIGLNDHATADYFFDVARINIDADNRGERCPSRNYRGGAAAAIAIAIDEVNNEQYDFTTHLASYPDEVLFISSDESDLGARFQEERQVSLFPNATHEIIEGTGHNGLINCTTERTIGYIRAYLERL